MSKIFAVALLALLGVAASAQINREIASHTAALDENKEFEMVRSFTEQQDFKNEIEAAQRDKYVLKEQYLDEQAKEQKEQELMARQHAEKIQELKLMQGEIMADGLIHLPNGETYFPNGQPVGGINKNQVWIT